MLVALIAIVFAIVAAVRAGQRRPYFYPLSIRLVDRAFLREERARAAG
ncbi:MAG TPA: DUF4870 domain-containing protein [Dermatophilaceae bacterium]|nr:DUF4870 domain-containing protein [Dermatophilaceae bacterium]